MPLKIPKTITEKQFLQLVNDDKVRRNPKNRTAYLLGFYQALRISEVCKLTQEHYDKETRLLHIKQAKGKKDRHIPVAPEIIRVLKNLPVGSEKAKDKGARALQIALGKDTDRIFGFKLNFHALRHSGATYYLNVKRWDIRQVQRFIGHSDVKTTQIYTHVNPEDLTKLMWGEE